MTTAAVLRALMRVGTAATVLAQPSGASAQKVSLAVHPRVGDTLNVWFEHTLTISGAARTGYAAVPPSTSTYRLVAREIVESITTRYAIVLATVDSVSSGTRGPPAPGLFPDLDRSLQGARIRLSISADGASTIVNSPALADPDLGALIGEMPAVLPSYPVAVGESWTRDLPVPVDRSSVPSSVLRTTIHLDSLTEAGNLAWISLRGTVTPTARADSAQRPLDSKGTLIGRVLLDRRRGWLLESHATVNIESAVAMPGGAEPLVVRVRVAQAMKTASARREFRERD